MKTKSDPELLREYVERKSEAAFAELVRRHVDLVYSVARRVVNDAHLAEDVAQGTFLALSRNAAQLTNRPVISGWLHRTAQHLASKCVRADIRRRAREQEAVVMNESFSVGAAASWQSIAPHLDSALTELSENDRDAVVLRFFEKKSAQEMACVLGLSDVAAQKRVSRAVERLREILARRGVGMGTSGLVVILSANAVQVAPVGLAAAICSTVAGTTVTTSGALAFLHLMAQSKLKLGAVAAILTAGVLGLFLLQRSATSPDPQQGLATPTNAAEVAESAETPNARRGMNFAPRRADNSPQPTAQEIVAKKLAQFGQSRRGYAEALARRRGMELPDVVKLFFDAVEKGDWNEIEARFDAINGGAPNAGQAAGRPPGVEHIWPAIIDAYGAAEQVHLWPPQQLLDYGNSLLESMRPGMIYVGGSDEGRWIPELLADTTEGERRIVITQNGLADGTYLEYLSLLYGDRLNTLTSVDGKSAFEAYVADAERRLRHDEEFPNEPNQLGPGEHVHRVGEPSDGDLSQSDFSVTVGKVQVSGKDAVMAINEKLLQTLMEKNPELSFAIQESFPLKGTYADALPLGPLMELSARDEQNTFTPERAAQALDYWRDQAQRVFADSEAAGSNTALASYSHNANSAANLFAAHGYSSEAEQTYSLARQLWPANPEPVAGLAAVMTLNGRADEARQMLEEFYRQYPKKRSSVESIFWTVSSFASSVSAPK